MVDDDVVDMTIIWMIWQLTAACDHVQDGGDDQWQ